MAWPVTRRSGTSFEKNFCFRGRSRVLTAFLSCVSHRSINHDPDSRLETDLMNATQANHPTGPTLYAYGLGKLEDLLADAVNKHLETCPDCRHRVAELSSDSFLSRPRDAQEDSRLRPLRSTRRPTARRRTRAGPAHRFRNRPTRYLRACSITPTMKSFENWAAAAWESFISLRTS